MKMKTLPWMLALLASAVCAQAQQPEPGQREGRGRNSRPMPPIIAALDTEKDGKISAAEIAASATSLKTLDQDADGQLTHEEIRPPRPARPEGAGENRPERPDRPEGPPPGMTPPPIIVALDADQDGVISAAEIEGAPAALAKLDQNNDGELTRDELHPGGRPPRDRSEKGEKGPHHGPRHGQPDGPPPAE